MKLSFDYFVITLTRGLSDVEFMVMVWRTTGNELLVM